MQGARKVPWFYSQHHSFAPRFLEVAVGFLVLFFFCGGGGGQGQGWSFCVLLFIIGPNCACARLWRTQKSFIVYLYFVAQGVICPGTSTAAKSSSSQVPACFNPSPNTPVTWCPHYTKNPHRKKKNIPIKKDINVLLGFPCGALVKEFFCKCRRHKTQQFDPWVWKIPWRRKSNPF